MTENTAVSTLNPFGTPAAPAPRGAMAEAVAQREVAEVQAGMMLAKRFPRDQRAAMDRILTACTRPTLAQAAVYQYSRGGSDVTGPSIRLAESIAQHWGNMLCGVAEVSRANGVSECLAYAWDLETGFRDEKRFQVRHWRDTKKGGYAITDERDIYELIANMGARRKRACLLAVIPGDVVEAAVHQCDVTLQTTEEVTPERIAKLVEAFGAFGVTRAMIEQRIQRSLDSITPALLVQMRKIYNSLRDGMSSAAEWFDVPTESAGTSAAAPPTGKVAEINAKAAKRAAAKAADAPPTYAAIAEAINRATNEDQRDTALSLIHEGIPEAQRAELVDMAKAWQAPA